MLALKSAMAKQLSNSEKSQGIRNRPGSPSFSGSFFRTTAEQFSFRGVLVLQLVCLLEPQLELMEVRCLRGLEASIVLLGRELELAVVELKLKVVHISIVRCGVGLEFALRNRVLLWWCLKITILLWTVLIDSSMVGLTVLILIEIIALETVLVVVLISRLMKSRWTRYPTDVALRIRDEDTDEIRASPSNEKGNSNNLTVVLGTSGCRNVDVTLLKNRRWLCGSCLM
nr:hypothetical protein [Tanacetum cinerariifolium]